MSEKDFIKLATWISEYYIHPFGDTLFNMLPNILRKGGPYNPYVMNIWKTSKKGSRFTIKYHLKNPKTKTLTGITSRKNQILKKYLN